MTKKWLGGVGLFLLSLPMALAFSLDNIWQNILFLGDLGFLGVASSSLVAAFTRILVWIAVFTIFFALATSLSSLNFLKKNQAMVVALVLATISAVFIPPEVLLGVGAGWATAMAFLLIGLPVVGIAWFLWKIPWEGEETKFTVFLKLVLCLILFWVLTVMKNYVGGFS